MFKKVGEDHVAHPGECESFAVAEAAARKILRERGLTDRQIDAELNRSHREEIDLANPCQAPRD